MKKVNLLIIALSGLLLSGLASAALVAVTNQNNGGTASISYVTDDLLRATSFTTGPEWTLLVSAKLEVSSRNAIGVEMTLTATVYANTDSQLPGDVVGVFNDLLFSQSLANRFEDVTFTTSGLLLQPNTKYWLALGGYGGNGADYKATSSNTETSTLGWTIGDSDIVSLIAPDTWIQTGPSSPIAFTLNVEAADIPSTDVLYGFVHGETGAILATVSFSEPPASSNTPWNQRGSSRQITGATLDYSSLGGPTFDWGVNIMDGGAEGLIDNISINDITSDGRTLNGGFTAVRFFVTSGQSDDPRYQVGSSLTASPTPGADTFTLSFGGSNGGVIDPEWVGVKYSGDWVHLPDVIYRFRHADSGAVLATVTFAATVASPTKPWSQGSMSRLITGATLDYSSLGGPVFDFGANILDSGSEGLIDNISENSITADGRTLDGGSTAIRFFVTSGQSEDPRFNVQASISGSPDPGTDTFGLSSGGTNNGGAIAEEWVGVYYLGDWDASFIYANGFED